MSKFLGPIHYIMYEKIKFQDILVKELLSKEELVELNKKLAPVSNDDLENLIDGDNIHGWLSSQIDIVESRLAYAIKKKDNAKEVFYNFGKSLPKENYASNEELFNAINLIILDGMPCDHALRVEEDGDKLYLITVNDLHEKYQEDPLSIDPSKSLDNSCEGSHDHDHHDSFDIKSKSAHINNDKSSLFYELRQALLAGFLEDYIVQLEGKNIIITKK